MLPPCLEHIQALGLAVFTSGDYNLNLFGIRSKDREAGAFDDLLGCAYKVQARWVVRYWPATTDPGLPYLETASQQFGVEGTAILAPGQYRGAYKIGLHGSTKYEALVQSGAPVRVYRDANRDSSLDMQPETLERGWFGINIHASSMDPYSQEKVSRKVGRWSAGCQVHASTKAFREMMTLAKKQVRGGCDTFTYTLLDQWW